MKTHHNPTSFATVLFALVCLTACEHSISTGSIVHEDGSLDRTIVLAAADSGKVTHNMMGVNEARGWETTVEPAAAPTEGKNEKYNITFTKHFRSVDEANAEMAGDADTLFQIRSSLMNKNRWFFTYMEYSDTYTALDRFKNIPQTDYFTTEDYAFIDRLPAEGSRITKSDSLYLARLNEKIFDFYGARTIFEAMFSDVLSVMREHNIPTHWSDTLIQKKDVLFQKFFKEGNLDDADLLTIVEGMGVPLTSSAQEAIRKKTVEIEKRVNFISSAYSGKYVHSIVLPWTVVSSNADSVNGNTLYWHPPAIKFLLRDYTMTAHARKMNGWQTGISAALILSTVGLFIFRRRIR